nr:hypothetical protein [Tanacetum cinerariifolium]
MNTTSRENASKTDDRIDKLADQILTLVDIFAKKAVTPPTVKAVEESCVTCGGNHAYYNCDATNSNQSSVCAATGTYNQKAVTPPTVKAVEESCVTCGGNHAYYNCDATNSNQSSVCAATGTYNQVKDNKENDKIRAKSDKIKSKREAWKSPESSPTKSKPSQNKESIK